MNSNSAADLALRLYGGVFVGHTALPGPRAKALVLALALSPGHPLSAAALIDEVWGLDAPAGATTSLHTMVSRIRSSQGPALILSSQTGYSLGLDAAAIDYWAVESLLASARSSAADPARALALLAQAREFAAGEAAAGAAASPALTDFRERTAGQQAAIARLSAQAWAAQGDHAQAARLLEPLAHDAPLDEPLQFELLTALHRSGQSNAALLALDSLRRRLRREIGSDPSPALSRLHRELLQATSGASIPDEQRPVGAGEDAPHAEPRATPYQFGLRAPPNQLLGRTADINGIEALMASGRLTTILGVGGLGKTRLALELANRAADRSPASVIFVELAGIRTPNDVWLALAEGTGIREARTTRTLADQRPVKDLRSRTLERLARQAALLVLDNCEHLVAEAASAVAEILALCPAAGVLTTSRAPLNIAGERVYQLQPLAIRVRPDTALPAGVALFNERALAARPAVHLDTAVVAALCRQLDGLPLAIELAAAKVRLMSVEDIARRLTASTSLLVNPDRAAPERHRTLNAVIGWSWELLGTAEQIAMRRLSRFPSGFSLDAACAVATLAQRGEGPGSGPEGGLEALSAADVELAVEALINQSLVLAEEEADTGSVRFRMLETVREFAAARLADAGEVQPVQDALAAWAVDFSLHALANSSGAVQVETIRRVTAEQENLLDVLRTAMASDGGPGSAATVHAVFGLLASYWSQRGMHGDVFTLASDVLDATEAYVPDPRTVDAAVFSLAAISVATMMFNMRRAVTARVRLIRIRRAGMALQPRIQALADLLVAAGSERRILAVMARLRHDPDDGVASLAMLVSGMWAENDGEPGRAAAFAERAYALAEKNQDAWIAGSAADNAAQLYSQTGQREKAILWIKRAIERMTLVGASPDVRQSTITLALNLAAVGKAAEAQAALDGIVGMPELGPFQSDIRLWEIAAVAETAFAAGNPQEGLRLYRSIERPASGRHNEGPMGMIAAAAQVSAELLYNPAAPGDPDVALAARRLRMATTAMLRLSPTIMDRPVMGTAALALGAWHARLAEPGSRRAAVALELLGTAEPLASREDESVLLRQRHEAAAVERHGRTAVENAKRSAAGLVGDKARTAERMLALLSEPALRGL